MCLVLPNEDSFSCLWIPLAFYVHLSCGNLWDLNSQLPIDIKHRDRCWQCWQHCQIWKGSGTRASFCNSSYSVLHPQFYEFTWSLWGCLTLTKFTRDYFIHERLCIYLLWEFHRCGDRSTLARCSELSLGLLTSCSVPLCPDAPFQEMHPYFSSCSAYPRGLIFDVFLFLTPYIQIITSPTNSDFQMSPELALFHPCSPALSTFRLPSPPQPYHLLNLIFLHSHWSTTPLWK